MHHAPATCVAVAATAAAAAAAAAAVTTTTAAAAAAIADADSSAVPDREGIRAALTSLLLAVASLLLLSPGACSCTETCR